jgi:hypothetical protein
MARQKGSAVQEISQETSSEQEVAPAKVRQSIPARVGAAGKALIAYLATGSIGVALVVFLVAKAMHC